jgi:hypothetical protein
VVQLCSRAEDEHVLCACAEAIRNLAAHPSNRLRLVQEGTAVPLVQLCSRPYGDPVLQVRGSLTAL